MTRAISIANPQLVIPAKAGIHLVTLPLAEASGDGFPPSRE